LWVAPDHGDECEAEEHEDQDDLAAGKPEFGLTVRLDSEDVEKTRKSFSFDSFVYVGWRVGKEISILRNDGALGRVALGSRADCCVGQ
jgi:hypothetical protein